MSPQTVPRRGPLTPTQSQLWALDHQGPPPGSLNLSYALVIDGPLNVAALSEALRALVSTHEPLRTTYVGLDGEVTACVIDKTVALRKMGLSPRRVDEAEAVRLALEHRNQKFDLSAEAPVRASLFELDRQRHLLLLTLHHIAGDGWSLSVLNRHLSRYYVAVARGEDPTPVPHTTECIDLARAERDRLDGPAVDTDMRWWLNRLRGATERPPMLANRRSGEHGMVHRQTLALPGPLTADLRTLSRQSGTSLFVASLTAFEVLIERWSGCTNPVIGTLAANRQTAAGGAVLGAHYNPLLLSTDISGDPSLAECLLRTSADVLAALDHQTMPFALLAERTGSEFRWDSARLPSTMFLMDRYPMEDLRLEGCKVTGLYIDDGEAITALPAVTSADLTFFLREAGGHLTLSALYTAGPLDDGSVAGAMRTYLEILTAMCSSPELAVSELEPPEATCAAGLAPVRTQGRARMRDVDKLAPVDALSPVGVWNHHPRGGLR